MSSNPLVAKGLRKLFSRRSEFVVIGLTGRTGSGCTTAAKLLSKEFSELHLPENSILDSSAENRKYRIVRDYAKNNWKPFFPLSISNVILSFLLDLDEHEIRKFFNSADLIKATNLENFISAWRPARESWKDTSQAVMDRRSDIASKNKFMTEWQNSISDFFSTVRTGLGPDSTKILQVVGDNIRKSGTPFDNKHVPENFYVLPDRITKIIELSHQFQKGRGEPTYVVLDALRNPFELLYFRERFSAFYVIAISTDDDDRKRRLSFQNYTSRQIEDLDEKEYPEKSAPLSGYDAFTSQNIQNCLEKSDIYISNNGVSPPNQEINTQALAQQLIKYFTLILHPGLVTPTKSERCMQIAFAAKANSGCISRQVGAAITDQHDSVKAIGWNDVPAGQVPCLLRRATDLIDGQDPTAFSDYENQDSGFRKQVQSSYKRFKLVDTGGRSSAFCFKTEYNTYTGTKNQVHTRSLHAEENAFLQIVKQGGQGISGGKLYSTASPCELCAKKAFQLGIKHIFYIDPYPGISLRHILKSGSADARPIVQLYQGAVGTAYHKLYDPVLPYKDELRALMEGEDSVQTVERPTGEHGLF